MSIVQRDSGLIGYSNQPVRIRRKIGSNNYSILYPKIAAESISYNDNTLRLIPRTYDGNTYTPEFDTHIEIDSSNMEDALTEITNRIKPDGRAFTATTISLGTYEVLNRVVYCRGKYLALISNKSAGTSRIMSSDDGVTFANYASLSDYYLDMCVVSGAVALIGIHVTSSTEYSYIAITANSSNVPFQTPSIDFTHLYTINVGASYSHDGYSNKSAGIVSCGNSIFVYTNFGGKYELGYITIGTSALTVASTFVSSTSNATVRIAECGLNHYVYLINNSVYLFAGSFNTSSAQIGTASSNGYGLSHYDPIHNCLYACNGGTLYRVSIYNARLSATAVYTFTNTNSNEYFDIQYIHGRYIYNIADPTISGASASYGINPYDNVKYYQGKIITYRYNGATQSINQALRNISYYNNMIYGIGSSDGKLYYSQTL